MSLRPSSPDAWSPTSVAAAATILMWGSSFVAIEVALVEVGPVELALVRTAIAASAFAVLLAVRGRPVPPPADLGRLALAGLLGVAAYNVALNRGQVGTSAGTASLLVGTVPIWTTLLSTLFLRERVRPLDWSGLALAFAGVALISADPEDWSRPGPGALFVLLAAVVQALYFVILKPTLRRYGPIESTGYAVCFGLIGLAPLGHGLVESLSACQPRTLWTLVYLGLGPAMLSFLCWSVVLGQLSASRATSLLFLVPVTAVVLGWIALGEQPAPKTVAGGALAIGGVALTRVRRR